MARIFLALSVDKDLNDQIIEIKKELKANLLKDANISWQKNDHHHLTVYFIGEMEPEQITQMNDDLSEYNFNNFSRLIEITDISFFPNENSQVLAALVKSNSHLETLYEVVNKIVVNIGLGSDLKTYRPHITLGRFKEKERPEYIFESFERSLKGRIKHLDVLQTEFNKGKTEYTLLKSFEL